MVQLREMPTSTNRQRMSQLSIMEEVENQTDNAVEDGMCVIKHSEFLSHINPGVLEPFFRMPRINWKHCATPDSLNGKLSEA